MIFSTGKGFCSMSINLAFELDRLAASAAIVFIAAIVLGVF
jgi:hypothetical protein